MDKFIISRYRFFIRAGKEGLDLPAFKGSALRGVMGRVIKKIACLQNRDNCSGCMLRSSCPYSYLFETSPSHGASMMKGYDSVPRPYVIEPPETERERFEPFEEITFDLLLYGRAVTMFPYLLAAFKEGGRLGLGRGKKKYRLVNVVAHNDLTGESVPIYDGAGDILNFVDLSWSGKDVVKSIHSHAQVNKVKIVFQTPALLTVNRNSISRIRDVTFEYLVRNLFRRFSSLYSHHHGEEAGANYSDLLEKAGRIECLAAEGAARAWERYSFRQDGRNRMEGFVGYADYAGELLPFMPYLVLGQWIHVGKWAAFGMGKYIISTV